MRGLGQGLSESVCARGEGDVAPMSWCRELEGQVWRGRRGCAGPVLGVCVKGPNFCATGRGESLKEDKLGLDKVRFAVVKDKRGCLERGLEGGREPLSALLSHVSPFPSLTGWFLFLLFCFFLL